MNLPTNIDTVIDGGGTITLDGQKSVQILNFNHGDFMKNETRVTLQHLSLINGKTTPTVAIPPAPAPCSQGWDDGEGGALYMRDGTLTVIDSIFVNNQAAPLGPDTGGGAIYINGSKNGFFVAAEMSLVRIRETQVETLANKGNRRAKIVRRLIQNLDATISAIQFGITVASLGLGVLVEPVFQAVLAPVFDGLGVESITLRHTVAILTGFIVNCFLLTVVGELGPKAIALRRTLPVALWVAQPLSWFAGVAWPFVWLLNHSATRQILMSSTVLPLLKSLSKGTVPALLGVKTPVLLIVPMLVELTDHETAEL